MMRKKKREGGRWQIRWLLFVPLIIVLAVAWYFADQRVNTKPAVQVSAQKVEEMFRNLGDAINPYQIENSYMPAYMAETLRWIYDESAVGRLRISLVPGYLSQDEFAMAEARYEGEMPWILISGNHVLSELGIFNDTVPTAFSPYTKNQFALAFVEEAEHLTRGPEVFPFTIYEQALQEEVRARSLITRQAVRPLLAVGQPVPWYWAEMDRILASCSDNEQCPEFVEFTRSRYHRP